VHLLYTGASGPVMPHALTTLFTAVRRFRERAPARAVRLRFHFLGTSYVAPGQGRESVRPLAEQHGVADLVAEVPHRLGLFECLRLQREADVLLLPGSVDPAYSPSKIYAYYLAGRPILGLVFRASVLESLLDDLACAHLVRMDQAGPTDAVCGALESFFEQALDGFSANPPPRRNDALFNSAYLAETLTARQCALFDRVTASQPA
jgi:hypothetical protein